MTAMVANAEHIDKPSFFFLGQFRFTFRRKLKFLMVLDEGDKGGDGGERFQVIIMRFFFGFGGAMEKGSIFDILEIGAGVSWAYAVRKATRPSTWESVITSGLLISLIGRSQSKSVTRNVRSVDLVLDMGI